MITQYHQVSTVFSNNLAERTGLEPATSGVTGRHSDQLNYRSKFVRMLPAYDGKDL